MGNDWIRMHDTEPAAGAQSSSKTHGERVDKFLSGARNDGEDNGKSLAQAETENSLQHHPTPQLHGAFRVYKRRWFGLFQLVLLNIVVSWDWLTFAASSRTCSQYFIVSEGAINWLSTGFLFAFVAISPATLYMLHLGPKPSIVCAAVFVLVGNWIRYGGARANNFGTVVFGQIIIGFAQPFVLAAPTRYSDLWFTDRGRVSATAVASLANPLGGALGQLIGPLWATNPNEVPNTVLYVAIISTVAALPSFFIPAKPPTPPSSSSALTKPKLRDGLRQLAENKVFWLISITFGVFVGFFNAISSLLNQIMGPYGYSEDQAGIAGALLIVVGLISSAVASPVIDRTKKYLLLIKICSPVISLCYLVFIWAPPTGALPAPYVVLSVLGASSFTLLPVTLEYLCEVTYPASPELSSVVSWTAGQLLGAIFIVIMNALKDRLGKHGPANNMSRALIFEAVITVGVLVCPMVLGVQRLGLSVAGRGRPIDAHRQGQHEDVDPEQAYRDSV